MTLEAYEAIGYGRAAVAEKLIEDPEFPDAVGIGARLAEQHALFVSVNMEELKMLLANLPARECNPACRCAAEGVGAPYWILLHRVPESRAIIDWHVRKTAIYSPFQGPTPSKEFYEFTDKMDRP